MENRKDDDNTNNNSTPNLTKLEGKEEKGNAQHEADEDFHEDFTCCVCLELLYKPVVLACGHISCFWCVHKTMSDCHESRCPVCRHSYNHFPSICQLLHFLLMKLYPVIYKRRERQVGEEEKEAGFFSPQLDHQLYGSNPSEGLDILECSPSCQQTMYPESHRSGEEKSSSCMNVLETTVDCGDDTTFRFATISETLENTGNAPVQEFRLLGNGIEHKATNQVSVDDLRCAECKRMLFQPVVLNCGHVLCESCVVVPEDGDFRCPVCQSVHSHGLPSVCLILEHFLEEQFPQLYAEKWEAFLKQTNCSTKQTHQRPGRSLSLPNNVYASWWLGNGPKVHAGVGCDFCGMFPIIGERYRCKDCVEKIGFDLCEACYKNPAKVPGRFNQQHKPEHQFEIILPRNRSYLFDGEYSGADDEDEDENDDSDTVEIFVGDSSVPIMSGDAPQDLGDDDTNGDRSG